MTPAGKISLRILCLLVVGTGVAWGLNRSSVNLDQDLRPVGFSQGVLQGALMPLALPNLLVGKDVTIYAPNNTGRTYKLGYALGVNLCGLIFFGFFFWRVTRWRSKKQP